ncbi:unnamed protein product [Symbiodinium natans]|uniref:Ribosome biogenesis protein SLX9 n=1 Tax=Symbiodinium natans TaxID=878477 RepID=A0A812HXU6_9DINO|nr:unnamed protein product [Symbiodinium natans]
MGRGLPNHLASLLRHAPELPEQVPGSKPKETGRAARRRAQNKRKVQKAQKASREQEAKDARSDREQARADKKNIQPIQPPVEVADSPPPSAKKRRARKVLPAAKKAKAEAKETGRAVKGTQASQTAALFDPEGAARDEALMRKLEKNLGIARDPAKRRKEERRIFEALGFDAADAGMEELPSSDEGPEEVASSHGPASARRPAEDSSSADAMAMLLETILGGPSPTASTAPNVKKLKRRAARSPKAARGT